MASVALEIISDNICPFCYLGYKKILSAIASAKAENLPVTFSIRFKPFLLDPTLPCDHGVSKKERYAAKFGMRVDEITAAMTQRGLPWGIKFDYGGNMSNTFLSHRLVEKAYEHGGETSQRSLIEELFAGYFENQKDVGDHDYLASVAVKTGVFSNAEEAKSFLESDELKSDVCGDVRKAQAMGVTGVPFTVINNKYAVSGAQEPEAFLQIFRKIAQGQCPCRKGDAAERPEKAHAAAPARADAVCTA